MRFFARVWLGGILSLSIGAPAVAEELIEDFPDPLGEWNDRWLFQNSNLQSIYVVEGNCDPDFRGNNACGIWLADCQECDFIIEIDEAFHDHRAGSGASPFLGVGPGSGNILLRLNQALSFSR